MSDTKPFADLLPEVRAVDLVVPEETFRGIATLDLLQALDLRDALNLLIGELS